MDYSSELAALQNEAEMPLEQLLDALPPEVLAKEDSPTPRGDFPTPIHSEGDEKMEVESASAETSLQQSTRCVFIKYRYSVPTLYMYVHVLEYTEYCVLFCSSEKKELESTLEPSHTKDAEESSDSIRDQTGEVSVTLDPACVEAEADGGMGGEAGGGVGGEASEGVRGEDEDYQASGSEGDEEGTISEQEDHEGELDHSTEMADLQREGELPSMKQVETLTMHTVHITIVHVSVPLCICKLLLAKFLRIL